MIHVKFQIESDLLESNKPMMTLNMTHLFPDEIEGVLTIYAVDESDLEKSRAIFYGLLRPLIEYELDQLQIKIHVLDTLLTQSATQGKTVEEAIKENKPPYREGGGPSLYNLEDDCNEWPSLPIGSSICFPAPVKIEPCYLTTCRAKLSEKKDLSKFSQEPPMATEFKTFVRSQNPILGAFLALGRIALMDKEEMIIEFEKDSFHYERMIEPENQNQLQALCRKWFKNPIMRVVIQPA